MTRNRFIENLKTVILVVLFLTTILLLYLLWGPSFSPNIAQIFEPESNYMPVNAADYIEPLYVAYCRGGEAFSFAADPKHEFAEGVNTFAAYNSAEALLAEISESTYKEAMGTFKSAQICLGYNVPFLEFCEYFGIGRVMGADSIEYMESFAFSEASSESVFIKDGTNHKFYRLLFAESHAVPENDKSDGFGLRYYAGDILGGGSNALISLSGESHLESLIFNAESDDQSRREMAEAVFGDTFDFVRRITDSFGNNTYMYGYGQKTLSSNVSGRFEYQSEQGSAENAGFFKELESALEFAKGFGGLEDDLVLCNVSRSRGKTQGYVFEFCQKLGGVRLYSEDGPALMVEICGSQVIRAERFSVDAQWTSAEDALPAAEPANVLANNCNHIYNISTNSMLAVDQAQAYSYVADNVRYLTLGYFESEASGTLIPCWVAATDTAQFYFDLYTAAPLGFERT